jgi:serine/threonine protein phosphatase PrpC
VQLIDAANAAGGVDNITVIIIDVVNDGVDAIEVDADADPGAELDDTGDPDEPTQLIGETTPETKSKRRWFGKRR